VRDEKGGVRGGGDPYTCGGKCSGGGRVGKKMMRISISKPAGEGKRGKDRRVGSRSFREVPSEPATKQTRPRRAAEGENRTPVANKGLRRRQQPKENKRQGNSSSPTPRSGKVVRKSILNGTRVVAVSTKKGCSKKARVRPQI